MVRRTVPLVPAATVVVVVGLAVTACGSSGAPSSQSGVGSSTSAAASQSPAPASSGPTLVAPVGIEDAGATRLEVPGGMDWITVAGGSAWTSNESITRLDGRTGAVLSTIELPGPTCLAPDLGFDSLWFGVCGSPEVLRVDPRTGKVLATIKVTKVDDIQEESSVAAGAGGVWLLAKSGLLVQIDPRTDTVARVADAPPGASAIRASKDALWVTVHADSTLLKIDPRTLGTLATIPVGSGPQFLALGGGAAWTLDQDGGTVTRVDLATAKAVATMQVDTGGVQGGDIAVGGGFVWARVTDGLVAKIDPVSNTVVARYGPSGGSGSVAADASAAWITAHDSDSVYRLPLG
jgi:virginiamycin B lyase